MEQTLNLLRRALDGTGDVLLPVGAIGAGDLAVGGSIVGDIGDIVGDTEDTKQGEPVALVVATSGSTGAPKPVVLSTAALQASAAATHEYLGGPGTWLLALPTQHIAGMQVLVRSLLSGTTPGVLDLSAGFTADRFATAATELADRIRASGSTQRLYTALVPTQLRRLLTAIDAGDQRTGAALAGFAAVLVGGAAASEELLQRAKEAGVQVVSTYGMTETCGGCVYDGMPLAGVSVRVDHTNRVWLAGPMLARGYLGQHGQVEPTAAQPARGLLPTPVIESGSESGGESDLAPGDGFQLVDGVRWFRTSDLGELVRGPDIDTGEVTDGDRLRVWGRADDVIVSGGVKVSPHAVEGVLADLPGIGECVVVGVPDPQWGQRVVALVTGTTETLPPLKVLRRDVSAALGSAAAPQAVHLLPTLPTLSPGKPHRAAATKIAARIDQNPSLGPPPSRDPVPPPDLTAPPEMMDR